MVNVPPITICEPGQPKIFTYAQASVLIPVLGRITCRTLKHLNPILRKMSDVPKTDPRYCEAEKVYQDTVQRWVNQVIRLGVEAKGMWIVDFDCGYGYLCWRYPEEHLLYFHDYHESFNQRRKLRMNSPELWEQSH